MCTPLPTRFNTYGVVHTWYYGCIPLSPLLLHMHFTYLSDFSHCHSCILQNMFLPLFFIAGIPYMRESDEAWWRNWRKKEEEPSQDELNQFLGFSQVFKMIVESVSSIHRYQCLCLPEYSSACNVCTCTYMTLLESTDMRYTYSERYMYLYVCAH